MSNSKYLYIFLDEGGNLDFSSTGSKYFTLTTVTQKRPFPWDSALIDLKFEFIEMGLDIEYFHASEDRQAVRDKVFDTISKHLADLKLDSLIIEKRKTAPSVQAETSFYPRMIGYLLKYIVNPQHLGGFEEVIVITDSIPIGKKRNAIEKAIKQTLSSMLPSGMKYQVLHHASKSCISLQIADYCNWAIFRKWERGDTRSYDLIKNVINSEFDIFASGTNYFY